LPLQVLIAPRELLNEHPDFRLPQGSPCFYIDYETIADHLALPCLSHPDIKREASWKLHEYLRVLRWQGLS